MKHISIKPSTAMFLLVLTSTMTSCVIDELYVFGTVKNESKRNILIFNETRPVTDSNIRYQFPNGLPVRPMGSASLNSGFGPPQDPPGRIWYFDFYDGDTVLLYLHEHRLNGLVRKAFLKRDSITQEQLTGRQVTLIYRDPD
jgi:hypothetical protein